MAKIRRRFYVVIRIDNSREVKSLKVKPQILPCMRISRNGELLTETTYPGAPIIGIVGPFRTFDDASRRIATC